MAQLIFTFTVNTETNEAALAGNVELPVASQILQQLVIADAVAKAKDGNKPLTQVEVEKSQ
jgi:hypothetical protein